MVETFEEIINKVGDIAMPFNEEEITSYVVGVYTRMINTRNMSLSYHNRIGHTLYKAVEKGYGKSAAQEFFGTPQYTMLNKMKTNVYQFSAAKQYQQIRAMSQFIAVKGEQSTFQEFKKVAGGVFKTYNEAYLRTEYNTALSQAESARQYYDIQENKDIFKTVEYRTQQDSAVRDEHAILHGLRLPVDDPFWSKFWPPNGWNCRCFVVPEETDKIKIPKTFDAKELKSQEKFPKAFQQNAAKTGKVFDTKSHPYFKVAKGDKQLREENFKMPV